LQGASRDILERTQRLWSERIGRAVSTEGAREAIHNVSVFFELLAQWDRSRGENLTEDQIEERQESSQPPLATPGTVVCGGGVCLSAQPEMVSQRRLRFPIGGYGEHTRDTEETNTKKPRVD